MRKVTCECGNEIQYVTVNDFIKCSKCEEMIEVIATPQEEMSVEDETKL